MLEDNEIMDMEFTTSRLLGQAKDNFEYLMQQHEYYPTPTSLTMAATAAGYVQGMLDYESVILTGKVAPNYAREVRDAGR